MAQLEKYSLPQLQRRPHTMSGEGLPPTHCNYQGKPLTNAAREDTPTTTRELTHTATREESS